LRAGMHGLVAWAVAILGTVVIVSLAGLAATAGGTAIAALYGVRGSQSPAASTAAYAVDVLFRPGAGAGGSQARPRANMAVDQSAHAEAERIVQAAILRSGSLTPDDRTRLSDLAAGAAGVTRDAAAARVDRLEADTRHTLDTTRRTASYGALWMAFSLIFGAIVAIYSAIAARLEDDFVSWRKSAGNAPGAILFGVRRR